jgi:predicted Ser/Thr protein kinase
MAPDVFQGGGSPPTDPVPTRGSERLGAYRLVQRIGEGGMGVVHLALDPSGRAVAIKVLRPGVAQDPQARARLQREVETLARINSPRVAPVIDADIGGPRPYIVTRYVAGDPLDDLVEAHGPLHGEALVRLARGLVGALEAIHAVGVVHRDLKPANVLVDDDGEPVVIDFGIAHVAEDVRLTSTGLVMGTPGYLSPEVIEGAPVTEATDWWGWAATLAFAATGRPPFGRGSMDVVLTRVRAGTFDLAGVDARLEPLLAAALSPHPQERPPAHLVMTALERFAAGAPATSVLPVGGADWVGAAATGVLGVGGTRVLPQESPWSPPAGHQPGYPEPLRSVPPPAAWAPAYPMDPPGLRGEPAQGDPAPTGAGGLQEAGGAPAGMPGEPDPRIGRPNRSGTLAAVVVLLAAAGAVAPMVAVVAAAGWSVLARFVDRATTSVVLRRFRNGRRTSDVAVTVAKSPGHLLSAAVATVAGGLMPALVGLATVFCVALVVGAATGSTSDPGRSVPTAVGVLAGILTAWWGLGGASLRRGSRSMARAVSGNRVVGDVVVGLLVSAAIGAVTWAFVRHGTPLWWPYAHTPALLSRLP